MVKNISEEHLRNIIPNALKELKNHAKQNRTDQLYPLGWFPLPVGTVDPVGSPDGSAYYNSSTHHIRALINGVWTTVI